MLLEAEDLLAIFAWEFDLFPPASQLSSDNGRSTEREL